MKAIIFFLFLISTSAVADISTPNVWGYGTKTCKSYIIAYKAWEQGKQDQVWEYFRYRDWLTGFVSALTLVTGIDMLHGVKPKNAMRRINLYCEENQGKDFFTASSDFIRLLGTGKGTSKEEINIKAE